MSAAALKATPLVVAICVFAAADVSGVGQPAADELQVAIRQVVAVRVARGGPLASALRDLYGPGAGSPLWIDGAGDLTSTAHDALNALRSAAEDGLDSTAYGVTIPAAGPGGRRSRREVAEFE